MRGIDQNPAPDTHPIFDAQSWHARQKTYSPSPRHRRQLALSCCVACREQNATRRVEPPTHYFIQKLRECKGVS